MERLHQTPPLRAQGARHKRRQKDCKSQRWGMIPRNLSSGHKTDAQMHQRDGGSTNTACTGTGRWSPTAEPAKWMWVSTPSQQAIIYSHWLTKEKLAFSNGVSLSRLTTLKDRSHGQHTMNSMVFL